MIRRDRKQYYWYVNKGQINNKERWDKKSIFLYFILIRLIFMSSVVAIFSAVRRSFLLRTTFFYTRSRSSVHSYYCVDILIAKQIKIIWAQRSMSCETLTDVERKCLRIFENYITFWIIQIHFLRISILKHFLIKFRYILYVLLSYSYLISNWWIIHLPYHKNVSCFRFHLSILWFLMSMYFSATASFFPFYSTYDVSKLSCTHAQRVDWHTYQYRFIFSNNRNMW